MRQAVALVCIALLLIVSQPADAAPFFYLIRQWPYSLCSVGEKPCTYQPSTEAFTLHGLWLNYDTGKWPQFCTHESFNASAITSLLPLMEQDWPSYYGPNEEFWAHEWEKHGTCAEDDFPTQLEYFNTTLALHVANPIETALAAAGVIPDPTATYTSDTIVSAIQSGLGSEPLVHCEKGMLTEIWMCLGEDLTFEDCDQACPGPGCHNVDCSTPMLYPGNTQPAVGKADCSGAACRLREAASKMVAASLRSVELLQGRLRHARTADA